LSDPRLILTVVVLLAALAPLVAYAARARSRAKRSRAPGDAPPGPEPSASVKPASAGTVDLLFPASDGPSLAARISRVALAFLALAGGAGFVLVLLPEGTVDRLAGLLAARNPSAPPQEKISFLYLGDEVVDGAFHVRGVVRNITSYPIEKLDATIRFYVPSGQLAETRSVRMDTEVIGPDATAQFHLVYPDYRGQFSSYSVEFVLRGGEVVPYKDIRRVRGRE
jgi:hypothetical protein